MDKHPIHKFPDKVESHEDLLNAIEIFKYKPTENSREKYNHLKNEINIKLRDQKISKEQKKEIIVKFGMLYKYLNENYQSLPKDLINANKNFIEALTLSNKSEYLDSENIIYDDYLGKFYTAISAFCIMIGNQIENINGIAVLDFEAPNLHKKIKNPFNNGDGTRDRVKHTGLHFKTDHHSDDGNDDRETEEVGFIFDIDDSIDGEDFSPLDEDTIRRINRLQKISAKDKNPMLNSIYLDKDQAKSDVKPEEILKQVVKKLERLQSKDNSKNSEKYTHEEKAKNLQDVKTVYNKDHFVINKNENKISVCAHERNGHDIEVYSFISTAETPFTLIVNNADNLRLDGKHKTSTEQTMTAVSVVDALRETANLLKSSTCHVFTPEADGRPTQDPERVNLQAIADGAIQALYAGVMPRFDGHTKAKADDYITNHSDELAKQLEFVRGLQTIWNDKSQEKSSRRKHVYEEFTKSRYLNMAKDLNDISDDEPYKNARNNLVTKVEQEKSRPGKSST